MAALEKINKKIIYFIASLFTVYLILLILDVVPFLRGPSSVFPEWRWMYFYTNTFDKIWFPILCIFVYIFMVTKVLSFSKAFIEKNEKMYLAFAIILFVFIQMSIIFFSRGGLGVLVQRTISPGASGYFTASLDIKSPLVFLKTYDKNVLDFIMHAPNHPPGGILLFWGMSRFFSFFPFLESLVSSLKISTTDIQSVWLTFSYNEKLSALFSVFFISFVSGSTVVPLYKLAKLQYGVDVGVKAVVIFLLNPGIILFLPLLDITFPFFTAWTLYFCCKAIKLRSHIWFFVSGLIHSCGLFFALNLLPLLSVVFIVVGINELKKTNYFSRKVFFERSKWLFSYIIGVSTLPFFLFLTTQFNFISSSYKNLSHGIMGRSYPVWVFYNVYDYIVFAGIPIVFYFLLVFFFYFKRNSISDIKKDSLLLSFFISLFILDISGTTRGETGRLWLMFTPIILIICAKYISRYKLSGRYFVCLLLLQAAQVIVMQEFWVIQW